MSEFDMEPSSRPMADLDYERATLGGMLLSVDAAYAAIPVIDSADFYDPRHALMFETITAMIAVGEPVDSLTVSAKLVDSGELARFPSNTYVFDCAESVPSAASTVWYAQRVVALASRRRLLAASVKITQIASNMDMDIDAAVESSQREIHEATTGKASSRLMSMESLMTRVMDNIDAAEDRPDGLLGTPTGLLDLDKATSGWRPGQLIIVAGRPGMGKSVFSVDAVRQAALRSGKSAALFSLEMSADEIGNRIMAAESGVPLNAVQSGKLTDDQLSKVAMTAGKISDAKLWVDDSPEMSLAIIRSRARRIKQEHGLDLVVVDYLQLMSSGGKVESRQMEVSVISRGLKLLAKELGVPVIAASQLNRGPENRQEKMPQMSDLRESGSIENDADMVVLLHRPSYYDANDRTGEVDVILAKNRHGATVTVTAAAQLHLSRFMDFAG